MPLVTTNSGIYEVSQRRSNDGTKREETPSRRTRESDEPKVISRPLAGMVKDPWKLDADLDHIRRVTSHYRTRTQGSSTDVTLDSRLPGVPEQMTQDQPASNQPIDDGLETNERGRPTATSDERHESIVTLIFFELVALVSLGMLLAMAPVSANLVRTMRTFTIVGGVAVILLTLLHGFAKRRPQSVPFRRPA